MFYRAKWTFKNLKENLENQMKKMSFKGRAKQAGFTLIELIVVIVILGIMAATALPKFMDIGADARLAKAQAGMAAVKSASAMAHGAMQVAGVAPNGVIKLEGVSYTLNDGYPSAADILKMAGIDGDYKQTDETPSNDVNTAVISIDAGHPDCGFTYTQATSTAAPTISVGGVVDAKLTLANCE